MDGPRSSVGDRAGTRTGDPGAAPVDRQRLLASRDIA